MVYYRLNKLLRRYNIGLNAIVSFLRSKGLNVEENLNAKISEDYLPMLDACFLHSEVEATQSKYSVMSSLSISKTDENAVSSVEVQANINLRDKRSLLIEIRRLISKSMSSSRDEIIDLLPEFNEINDKWLKIGSVPEDQEGAITRIYDRYCEEFNQLLLKFQEETVEEFEPDDENFEEADEDVDEDEFVSLKVESISFPGRVITEGFGDYKAGVLFPEHITCNGQPVSSEWSRRLIKNKLHIDEVFDFSIIKSLSQGDYAILGFDWSFTDSAMEEYDSIPVGDIFQLSIFEETANYYFVQTSEPIPLIGIVLKNTIDKENDIDEEGTIRLELAEKAENPLSLHVFVKPTEKQNTYEAVDVDALINDFLRPEEIDVIPDEDLALVRYMLQTYPTISKYNRTQISCDIYCRIPENSLMQLYLNRHPGFLDNQSFWVSFYREKGTNAEVITLIHADPTIVIEIRVVDDHQFVVTNFDSEGTKETRNIIKYNNKKAKLTVSSSYLHFVNRYESIPTSFSTSSVIDFIEKLSDFNSRILNEARNSIKDNTYLNARDYTTLGSYLRFQRNQERELVREPRFIEPSRIASGAGDSMGDISLRLELLPDDLSLLLYEEEDSVDGIHVAIVDDGGEYEYATGIMRSNGICTTLNFNRDKLNIEPFLSEGIYIRRRVNTKHLEIQIEALDGFVRRDSLGVYQELINGRLAPTDESKYDSIEFINPKFKEVGSDNNQTLAVKKAMANENVFLIQGPPGTGKTTIIVEIINQLVKEGKKVLVCSQAHAAVSNIYERLDCKEIDILRLDDRDDAEFVSINFDSEVYSSYLTNTSLILRKLNDKTDSNKIIEFINTLSYAGGDAELTARYRAMHKHVVTYYTDQEQFNPDKVQDILSTLEEETANITGLMLQAQYYRTKDVIMGTCIGIGMDKVLGSGTVDFDTVIIDEAGKANLAETIVPMQLGKRFILVGDHRQLPPFIDRQDVIEYVSSKLDGFEESSNAVDENNVHEIIDVKQIVSSLSNSLFADFYEHPNFPAENKVTLNYQYRMNPEIGDYISELFYEGILKSGPGTENQTVYIDGYPDAVTFVDTSTKYFDPENNPKESSTIDGSFYNEMEISLICNDILPAIQKTLDVNSDLKLGIITPYKSQYLRLLTKLADTEFNSCVHTIDSIQGSEFDIVIFSFVRSFAKQTEKTVGFLDDMRRLNVSLSRAKKKLILVGNLHTLTRPEAHSDYGIEGMVSPVEVFKSIGKNVKKFSDSTDFEYFMASSPFVGSIYKSCPCTISEDRVIFEIPLPGRSVRFSTPIPFDWDISDTIDIVYSGIYERDGKPKFNYAGLEMFAENHSVGEVFDAIVSGIKTHEDGSRMIFLKVCGVRGLLNENGTEELNLAVGDSLKVAYRSFNQEKRRLRFAIPMSMAESVLHLPQKRQMFKAKVVEYYDFPAFKVEFEDGSELKVELPLLWHVSKEGEEYNIVRFQNGSYNLNHDYYNDFISNHSIGERILGEVLSEDDYQFYVKLDGAFAVITKKYLKGRELFKGEKRMFQVFRLDDKYKTIILGL